MQRTETIKSNDINQLTVATDPHFNFEGDIKINGKKYDIKDQSVQLDTSNKEYKVEVNGVAKLKKDAEKDFLKDKTTVIGGPSGVGKSSFINFLQSEKTLKTGEISEKLQRGKHTTRDSNMIKMKVGGYIIDTPGFSSIEVPNIENREELISLFPEFSNIDSCRFLNCSHVHEPGCNVKKEVEENKISKDRYKFYKKTLEILLEMLNRYD